MTDKKPTFAVDLGNLKSRRKTATPAQEAKAEAVAEDMGFVAREAQAPKKRGRKPSPRTGQVHARVMPGISEEIAEEARLRGVQQGVIIEEAWALYQANKS